MPLYENAVIYKLKHNEDYDDLNIYIGSTCNFKNRKYGHKNNCKNEKRKQYYFKVYEYIRKNGDWDQWVMIPIEQYNCNNKKELQIRERYHIDLLKPTLNMNIPTRSPKEYRENNKVRILKNAKEYREDNKEKYKEYYNVNKETILERNKQYKYKYYQNNTEKYKEYYQKNKTNFEKKIKCDHCGSVVRIDTLKKHQKRKKCLNFVKKDF